VQIKNLNDAELDPSEWATHSLPYSPETQGVYCEGVVENDIICCERSRKYINVFVVGDRYSKIKLFNYPSQQNKIYNRYVGHSHEVTGLQFDRRNEHLISIGGDEKSIIVWKYNPEELKN
jgi:microtubule-associated protein-like 6